MSIAGPTNQHKNIIAHINKHEDSHFIVLVNAQSDMADGSIIHAKDNVDGLCGDALSSVSISC